MISTEKEPGSHSTDLPKAAITLDENAIYRFGHTPFLLPDQTYAALSYPELGASRQLARAWEIPFFDDRFDAFFGDAEFDVLLILRSIPEREKWAEHALKLGKHALYLPPLSTDHDRIKQLASMARENGLLLEPIWPMEGEKSFQTALSELAESETMRNQMRCHWMIPLLPPHMPENESRSGFMMSQLCESFHFSTRLLGQVQTVSAEIRPPKKRTRQSFADFILNHQKGVSIHHLTQAPRKDVRQLCVLERDSETIEISIPSVHDIQNHQNSNGGGRKVRSSVVRTEPMPLPPIPAALVHMMSRISVRDCHIDEQSDIEMLSLSLACIISSMEQIKVTPPVSCTPDVQQWLRNA
jgi:predicted dehydrogenase